MNDRAKELDSVRLTAATESIFDGRTIPAEMQGAVLEVMPDGTCLVELAFRPQTATDDGDFVLALISEGQYDIVHVWRPA